MTRTKFTEKQSTGDLKFGKGIDFMTSDELSGVLVSDDAPDIVVESLEDVGPTIDVSFVVENDPEVVVTGKFVSIEQKRNVTKLVFVALLDDALKIKARCGTRKLMFEFGDVSHMIEMERRAVKSVKLERFDPITATCTVTVALVKMILNRSVL